MVRNYTAKVKENWLKKQKKKQKEDELGRKV